MRSSCPNSIDIVQHTSAYILWPAFNDIEKTLYYWHRHCFFALSKPLQDYSILPTHTSMPLRIITVPLFSPAFALHCLRMPILLVSNEDLSHDGASHDLLWSQEGQALVRDYLCSFGTPVWD
jgi:hypothetical protein